jgi:hypothetical protein
VLILHLKVVLLIAHYCSRSILHNPQERESQNSRYHKQPVCQVKASSK